MIVTAVVEPSSWGVRLTATGYTGIVSWYRSEGRDVYIGQGPVLVDRSAPLNQPLTYSATDDVSTVTAAAVTVDTGKPILSSTMSNVAKPVTVVSFRPYTGQGRSVWHPVIGRSDPFVSVFPATYPGGDLVVRCETNDERIALIQELLQPGHPLLLRSTCRDRLDTMTLLMTSWSDPFPVDSMREGATHMTISYQRVTEVSPAYQPPARTFDMLLAEAASFDELSVTYGTFQDVLDGTPVP